MNQSDKRIEKLTQRYRNLTEKMKRVIAARRRVGQEIKAAAHKAAEKE